MTPTEVRTFAEQTDKHPTTSDFYELLLDNQSASFTPEALVKATAERFQCELTEQQARSIIEGFVHRGYVRRAYRRYCLVNQNY